ncbi:facilitated trehalose transporter Tret1 isoform X1 [Lutzomyia longipalpis]|nr:facilitated trehalose transporter Tret1 isoform X1 [Lutzomyia longipalpis]
MSSSKALTKAMVHFWQNMSQKEDDPNSANPMLYDPIQDGIGTTRKLMQFIAATIVALGAVSAGTVLAWTSPVVNQLRGNDSFNMTDDQESWVGSLLAIGAFFGAIPAGILADMIGRKYINMALALPFLISWGFIIFATNIGMIYAGRIFAGIATGAVCVVAPMFISEIGETSIRGALGSFFQLFLTMGILLVYAAGSVVDWRTLSGICAIAPAMLAVGMIFLPESPVHLVKKERRNDAIQAIKWLWGKQCNSRAAIQVIQNDVDAAAGKASMRDLWTIPANRAGLIICLCLMLFQQISGINAVIFYTQPIFQSAGSSLDASLCTIIVGVVQVFMTFGSTLLIDKAGRRILLMQSSIVMGACLTMLGIYFHLKDGGTDVTAIGWLPLVSLVLFIVSFSLGFGPIPWMMMGELFGPDVKGMASSIAVMLNWTLVFIVTKSFGMMNVTFGSDVTFWIFAVCMAIATTFTALKVPETKGKSGAEIQMILAGKQN